MLHIFKRRLSAQEDRLRDISSTRSLRWKLRLGLMPPIVIVLILTGYLSFRYHAGFIREAFDRTARFQVHLLSREVASFLAAGAEDLRFIARNSHDPDVLREQLANLLESSALGYRELSFISQKTSDHWYFFAHDNRVHQADHALGRQIEPNPLHFYEPLSHLSPGEVWVSGVKRLEYPLFSSEHPNQKVVSWVIFFGTPVAELISGQGGYLLLAADARGLRNILSAHRAESLSLWPYAQGTGKGGNYFVDTEGWMLFESEAVDSPQADPGTDTARAGYTGTLGNGDLPLAFLPDQTFDGYWHMIDEIRNGRSGVRWEKGILGDRFTAYAPVRFSENGPGRQRIYGGVTISERTRLTEIALFKQVDVMFIIIMGAGVLFLLLIEWLGRAVSEPIRHLAASLDQIRRDGLSRGLAVSSRITEIHALQTAVNHLLEDTQQKNTQRQMVIMAREAAVLKDRTPMTEADLPAPTADPDKDLLPEIMGVGPRIDRLKQEIIKAAQADADVLILGETGTGKQLAAEAIHRHSRRANRPFVAINCGELDENLLLDTLFGHVKGAFTEARSARKGAFVEAEGGILFMDEIQTASSRVQQALLRATAQRRIKPLGSDREIDVDVRLIAATNLDLSRLVEENRFRQDLYFRLKVITLATPPLREQPESIAVLAWHYFLKAKTMARKEKLLLTRGAVEKMKRYQWAGNVRELINCIMRAVVMAEGREIGAEDIVLEGDEVQGHLSVSDPIRPESPASATDRDETDAASLASEHRLNDRQTRILPFILNQGGITRSEYQGFWKDAISSRTALYDLQELVDKGLLRKFGRGPSTRYIPCAQTPTPQKDP